MLPTFRGILTSIYFKKEKKTKIEKIRKILISFYKKNKFIKILKLNSQIDPKRSNTNFVEISVCKTRFSNKAIIFCALDNLVKGASGQAIQNMNLLFKYPEHLGLK